MFKIGRKNKNIVIFVLFRSIESLGSSEQIQPQGFDLAGRYFHRVLRWVLFTYFLISLFQGNETSLASQNPEILLGAANDVNNDPGPLEVMNIIESIYVPYSELIKLYKSIFKIQVFGQMGLKCESVFYFIYRMNCTC